MSVYSCKFFAGNERAIVLFLLFESALLLVLIGLVRFCCTFWAKEKLKDQGLGSFLDKRVSTKLCCLFLFFFPLFSLLIYYSLFLKSDQSGNSKNWLFSILIEAGQIDKNWCSKPIWTDIFQTKKIIILKIITHLRIINL